MGGVDRNDRSVSARRRLVRRLRAHGDVVRIDFTRDGFRTVFVEVASDDGFDRELRREIERAGYTIEPPGTDEYRRWRLSDWWDGAHEAVRVLRLDPDREPAGP
jgi:hypothetical protein